MLGMAPVCGTFLPQAVFREDMRIGVNLLSIIPGHHAGIYTHARNLLYGLNEIEHPHEIVLFTNSESYGELDVPQEFEQVKIPISGHSRPQRLLAEQFLLPIVSHRKNIDVLHSVDYLSPQLSTSKTTTTIHDVNYEAVPEGFGLVRRTLLSVLVPLSAKSADRVVTVSEFSKGEICEVIGVDPGKVGIVPNALPDTLVNVEPGFPEELPLTSDDDYLLYVGTTHPHKNIPQLIEAVSLVDDFPHLVLCGPKRADAETLREVARARGIADRVHLPGFVSDSELAGLYSGATAYVHPSRYEGFGIPLLEAMYFDTPVVASEVASIPEVAGDAALYFDPDDREDMAAKISTVLEDESLRRELVANGQERLKYFSWEDSARLLLKNLETLEE